LVDFASPLGVSRRRIHDRPEPSITAVGGEAQ